MWLFRGLLSLWILTAVGLPACGRASPGETASEPKKIFEELWRTFDREYALFECKGVDWDGLYDVYEPRVRPAMSDAELFDLLGDLLERLNDNHVELRGDGRRAQSGILGQADPKVFSLDLVVETYLREPRRHAGGAFHSGWLAEGVGYVHVRDFGSYGVSTLDEVLGRFGEARAMVVDVRHNGGGSDRLGQALAGRFADRRRHYMTSMPRSGPREWYVEPSGPDPFTGPVVVLQNRFSVSAAENFVLAMRTLPHVTTVGETTSGAFADVTTRRLSNGWSVSVSRKLFVDADGVCWEGVGIPPNLRVVATPEQIAEGRDRALDFARSWSLAAMGRRQVPVGAEEPARPVDVHDHEGAGHGIDHRDRQVRQGGNPLGHPATGEDHEHVDPKRQSPQRERRDGKTHGESLDRQAVAHLAPGA